MLLTLMMNIGMFGGNTPVIPPQPRYINYDQGGTGGEDHKKIIEEENRIFREKLLREDDELLAAIKIFMQCL